MKKIVAALLCVALAAAGMAGCSKGGSSGDAALFEDESAVATYGDMVVTMSDYAFYYRNFQSQMEWQAMAYGGYTEENMEEYWNSGGDEYDLRDELAQQALIQAKQFIVLINAAQEAGTVVDAEAEGAALQEVEAMEAAAKESGEDFYESYGVTLDKMREMYVRYELIDQFQSDMLGNIRISDEDVQAAFDQEEGYYDQVVVRHVLFLSDDTMSEEAREEARLKAEDTLERLANGEDIGELAGELSEDPGSVENNGEYTFGRGMMVAEFEDWAFSAEAGDQGIVQTSYGYHVMELMERLPATLEEVRTDIENSLFDVEADRVFAEIIAPADAEWEVDQAALDRMTI